MAAAAGDAGRAATAAPEHGRLPDPAPAATWGSGQATYYVEHLSDAVGAAALERLLALTRCEAP